MASARLEQDAVSIERRGIVFFGSLRSVAHLFAAKYFKISCQLCRHSRQGKPGQVNANLIDFSSGLEIENDTIKFKVGCVLSFDSYMVNRDVSRDRQIIVPNKVL